MIKNLVSTIIPVHNRPEMLRIAVDSVLKQTHQEIEILIADDGSTDSTASVAQQLVSEYPQVIKYARQENSGPGPARELGRKIAKGEFLQYLDSDDRLLPNKFADQVAELRRQPDCDIAYGITRLVDADGNVLAEPFKWTGKEIPHLYPGLLVDRWWSTHTPLYRRRLTDQIGSWCSMRWSQDWEYDSRIGAMNVKLASCQTVVSEHVDHDGVRQTGDAGWQTEPRRLRNRVELLTALWSGAVKAGVPEEAPERQHFARWCFAVARWCARERLREEAEACLALAAEAAGERGHGKRGVGLYRLALRSMGAGATGRLESLAQKLRRRPGAATMDQSFAPRQPG